MILKSSAILSVKGFNSLEEAIKYNEAEDLPLETYTHLFPELPTLYNKKIKIGTFIRVNLFKYKCNCIPFKNREDKYENRDIRIACNHIEHAISFGAWENIDALTLKILKNQVTFGEEKLFYFDDKTILGTTPRKEWIRIYYVENGNCIQYYYSKKQKRFSHGYKPPKWEEIENILLR